MLAADQLKRFEVLHDGQWVPAQFGQLEAGDRVREYEPGQSEPSSEYVVKAQPTLEIDEVVAKDVNFR